MTMTSIGDLAQGHLLRVQTARLKAEMRTLSTELATGRVADPAARLGGDLSVLSDIERSIGAFAAHATAAREAGLFAAGVQSALERVQTASEGLSAELMTAGRAAQPGAVGRFGPGTRVEPAASVAALNGRVAGQSLFAGTATDMPALKPAGTILAEARGAIPAGADAERIIAAVTGWFSDPAGFAATAYSGADQPLAPYRTGPEEAVAIDVRATDPAIREVLAGMVLAALADDPGLGLDATGRDRLLAAAGGRLLAAQDGMTQLRGAVGAIQARIDESAAASAAARSGLEIARNEMISADPHETASRLEEVRFRLESLFAVTARTAGLTLTRFLG